MSAEQKDNRTASQRLDDVERVVASLYNGLQQLANGLDSLAKSTQEFPMVRQGVQLLSKRLECLISIADPLSGISPANVDAAVVLSNVADLKEQINVWLGTGAITATDTVGEKTFVVALEKDAEGKVANPRIQFALEFQREDLRTALTGKKVGETISFGEGKLDLEITELYTINEPKPPVALAEAPAAEAAPTELPAPIENGPFTAEAASEEAVAAQVAAADPAQTA